MGAKVSVVVTCFNYGHYLRGCLESAFAQTYPDLEVVLVDDGSTDATPGIARAFPASRPFRYVRQENRGQAAAKNVGIANSTGDLVAFLDADDLWAPDKLALQVPCFDDPDVGVVSSGVRYIDERGDDVQVDHGEKYLTPRSGDVTRWLLFDNFVPFSSTVVRRALLRQHGGFDETLAMGIDWDLWLRLSLACRFAHVDRPVTLYRVGHAGQMSKRSDVRLECADRIFRRFVADHRTELSPSLVRRARAYTALSRAWAARRSHRGRSTLLYVRALGHWSTAFAACRGIGKNVLLSLAAPLGRRAAAREGDTRS
jgi:glycosyltransferase involved in cell wall biosynthesis